jgi:hypothetical protein
MESINENLKNNNMIMSKIEHFLENQQVSDILTKQIGNNAQTIGTGINPVMNPVMGMLNMNVNPLLNVNPLNMNMAQIPMTNLYQYTNGMNNFYNQPFLNQNIPVMNANMNLQNNLQALGLLNKI